MTIVHLSRWNKTMLFSGETRDEVLELKASSLINAHALFMCSWGTCHIHYVLYAAIPISCTCQFCVLYDYNYHINQGIPNYNFIIGALYFWIQNFFIRYKDPRVPIIILGATEDGFHHHTTFCRIIHLRSYYCTHYDLLFNYFSCNIASIQLLIIESVCLQNLTQEVSSDSQFNFKHVWLHKTPNTL